jgi:Holliday junction resolvasome RuvABC endonuclease subunit
MILLDETGKILATRYSHDVKKVVEHGRRKALAEFNVDNYHVPKKKKKGQALDEFQAKRLFVNYLMFKEVIETLEPSHVAIEGYAFSRGTSAYSMAETVGVLKLLVLHRQIPLRLYTTNDVKMFATSFGAAEKFQVADAIKARDGIDFSAFAVGSKDDVVFDLSDAYTVASLLRVEALLRVGKLRRDELDERTIRVFQRTTRKNPVNVLGRDWIMR